METYPSQEYHGAVPLIFSGSIAMVEGLISRLLLVISDNSSYTMLYPGINNLKWPQGHPQDWCTSTKKSQHFFFSPFAKFHNMSSYFIPLHSTMVYRAYRVIKNQYLRVFFWRSWIFGVFLKWWISPKMLGLEENIYKWMIWGYTYFRKPPFNLTSIGCNAPIWG
jgi:hypothetical protein